MALLATIAPYTAALAAVGGPSWTPVFTGLANWIRKNASVAPVGLSAPSSGGTLTGAGTITASTSSSSMNALGATLASNVLSQPPASQAVVEATPYWASFARAVITTLILPAQVAPGTLTSTNTPISPGVVSGIGKFVPVGGPVPLTALIVSGLPVTDSPGQAAWLLPATQILLWLTAGSEIIPDGVVATSAGGGPPIGTLKIQ